MSVNTKTPTISETVVSSEKDPTDLDQALSVAGLGWYNIKYSIVLALFLIACIVEPTGYSFVLPAAKCDLDMTDAQRGFIASVPYLGIVITSYPWGYLVDTQGRKLVIMYSALGAGFFGMLAAFMPEIISFIICKFLCSLCLAGAAAVPYTFIGEIIPPRYKDVTLSIVNAMQILGSTLVPLFAWGVLPLTLRVDFGLYDFRSWRLLVIVNAALFIIAAILMAWGPESPKYLVAQGKHDEALCILQTVYAGNKRKSPLEYPVKILKMPDDNEMRKRSFLSSLKEQSLPLLLPPYAKWMALNGFLLFGVFASLNGLYAWVPDILNRVISGEGQGLTACQVIAKRLNQTVIEGECIDEIETSTYIINTLANSICGLIALAGSVTVKIIGKKALLLIVFGLIGAFCVLINFVTQDMVFAAILSSIPITGLAIGPVNAYSVEIFPTQLRGMAVSLTMMVGRVGSVVGTNVAGLLLNVNCEMTFYLFGGLLLLCGIFTFLLPRSQVQPRRIKTKLSTLSTHL